MCRELGIPETWAERCEDSHHRAHDGSTNALRERLDRLRGAGKLANLDARFRDHTIRIFNRFGMRSVAYWHPVDEPDSKDTLIYILEHKGRDAAKASWSAFLKDPEWRKVAQESQKDGRFLRERPESIFIRATDYSAIR